MKKVLFVMVALIFLVACNSTQLNKSKNDLQKTESAKINKHVMLGVKGSCDMCKTRIENAAKSVKGVSTANWDKSAKKLHLNLDSRTTNVDIVSKAIAKSGHDTDKDKADDAVYNALPKCCKYRAI